MSTNDQTPEEHLDDRDFNTQLSEANAFFNDQNMVVKGNAGDPYADKYGLVQFICGNELQQDPAVQAKIAELRQILISIVKIVTSYVFRVADQGFLDYKTYMGHWDKALANIPLLWRSKAQESTYSKQDKGTAIPASVCEQVLGFVPGEGPTLNRFRTFITNQGGLIRKGVEENKNAYRICTIGISVEVLKANDQIHYRPKISRYVAYLSPNSKEWTASCTSDKEVHVYINYSYAIYILNYRALDDAAVKTDFDDFIRQRQKVPIEDAPAFFTGDFEAKN
jgi:Virulence factor Evf